MNKAFPDQLLSQLSVAVAEQTGLHFPRGRWADLERGIRSAARHVGYPDAEAYAAQLLAGPLDRKGIEILAGELTVGETYFFREKQSLELLSEQILPEIIRGRQGVAQRLRIWSAGCCTGEEPYTLAILLDRVFPQLSRWQVTILGTDINQRFLHEAAEGIFSEWSFRDSPPWLKPTYFKPCAGNRYEIIPRIKERVTFAYLNLAEDDYPSLTTNTNAMDVIFCRNVLMYFSPSGTRQVVHGFRQCLVDQGWLIVSPTEVSSELFGELAPVQFPQATMYRKGERSPRESVFPWSLETAPQEEKIVPVLSMPASHFISPPPPTIPEPEEPQIETSPATFYDQALALYELGNYREASEKLKGDASPTAKCAALQARICANLGDLAEALAWTEKALSADKMDAGLHYLRAIVLQEQGIAEEVVPALKRALYLAPDFVLAHFALGNAALQNQSFKEADRHFANVLGLLVDYETNDVLPHSDGLVAGRLKEMVTAVLSVEKAA